MTHQIYRIINTDSHLISDQLRNGSRDYLVSLPHDLPQHPCPLWRQIVWPLRSAHNRHDRRGPPGRQDILQQGGRSARNDFLVAVFIAVMLVSTWMMRQIADSIQNSQLHGIRSVYGRTALATRRRSNVMGMMGLKMLIVVALQRGDRRRGLHIGFWFSAVWV